MAALHPYLPESAVIAGFVLNESSVPFLLTIFFGCCGLLFTTTYFVAKSVDASLTRAELLTMMWFVLSGSIHMCFEGYYSYNHATLGSKQTILGQLWKEYAYSDSRYLTNDAFVLTMETTTAFLWGPWCIAVAVLVALRHPLRLPLQMIVSVGQLYGVILYYATAMFDHYTKQIFYSRPDFLYFWFYFFFMNFIWVVIPVWLIYESVVKSAKAISIAQRVSGQLDAQLNGHLSTSKKSR